MNTPPKNEGDGNGQSESSLPVRDRFAEMDLDDEELESLERAWDFRIPADAEAMLSNDSGQFSALLEPNWNGSGPVPGLGEFLDEFSKQHADKVNRR